MRKISGFQRPSPANAAVFQAAVAEIAHVSTQLLADLKVGARGK